jgi:RNA recognition motif-containing protein
MKIHIGNIPNNVTEDVLDDVFSEFGDVSSTNVIKDKHSGRSKGYGFVEMPNDSDANEAIKVLDSSPLQGRNIRVNKARARREPPKQRRGKV